MRVLPYINAVIRVGGFVSKHTIDYTEPCLCWEAAALPGYETIEQAPDGSICNDEPPGREAS